MISLATYFATPDSFIFFGILHAITASSLIGLAFLRLPWFLTILIGVLCLALPQIYRNELFNVPWLSWIGLFTVPPRSNDFVPLMPWLGPFLIGMGVTRIAVSRGLTARLASLLSQQQRHCPGNTILRTSQSGLLSAASTHIAGIGLERVADQPGPAS